MMLCCGLISLLTVSSCSRKGETQDAEPVKVKTMTDAYADLQNKILEYKQSTGQ